METGMVYTNLPLNCEKIAAYCAEKHGLNYSDTFDRLHIIPREEEEKWRDAGTPVFDKNGNKVGKNPFDGPWKYLEGKPLSRATIIIDEIHNFCGSIGTPKEIANCWQKWLGELGHNQAVFRCLSQAPEKVHNCIKQEAQAWYTIRNTGLDRDPYFKIEIYDWLELWGGLFGAEYKVFVFEQESKKTEGRRERGGRSMHRMGMPYFEFYNSFNAPIAHAQTGNVAKFEHEYERHIRKGFIVGRLSLAYWFYRKNWQQLTSRAIMTVGVLLLLVGFITGWIPATLQQFMTAALTPKKAAQDKSPAAEKSKKPAPTIVDTATPATPRAKTPDDKATVPPAKADALFTTVAPTGDAKPLTPIPKNPVTLMTPTSITLEQGQTYLVGQHIRSGEHAGRQITGIDWQTRSATLDDNTTITFGD